MKEDERRLIRSLVIPFLFVFLLWVIRIVESIGGYDLAFLGIYSRSWEGLIGILTSPLVHGSYAHLLSNTVPLMVLGSAMFLFYKDLAPKIFILIYLLTGIWVWIAARPAYHIGASGVVYGLAAFLFTSGLIRKHTGLLAVSLVVVFLYGSLVWGIFPEFFPEKNISWESHLLGGVAGIILAIYFRKEGPQRRKYSWELEEEMMKAREEELRTLEERERTVNSSGDENVFSREDEYWNVNITDEEIKQIKRVFRPRKYDNN